MLAELCYQLDFEEQTGEIDEKDKPEITSDKEVFENLISNFEAEINHAESQSSMSITSKVDLGNQVSHQDIPRLLETESHSAEEEKDAIDKNQLINVFDQRTPVFDLLAARLVTESPFRGAFVDTGAQKSVIGKPQAQAYCKEARIPFKPKPRHGRRLYKFGDRKFEGMGLLEIRIPVTDDFFLSFDVEVVNVDVPLLIGLEFLDTFKVSIDLANDRMLSRGGEWEIHLKTDQGHLFVVWNVQADILFTLPELRKCHRHFYHPESQRLFAILRRSRREECSPQILQQLEEIERSCDVCQRMAKGPNRFRVTLPQNDIIFNRTLSCDLFTIEGKITLHIVDRDTKFNAAAFLNAKTSEEVWKVYQTIWSNRYAGHPVELHVDSGPQFVSNRFRNLCQLAGISLKISGVESHNSIGVGERYHSFLRRIYQKVIREHPNINNDAALEIAVRVLNDTAGPNGLVPTLLVFGVMPRMPIRPMELPSQLERMTAIHAARKELSQSIASHRVTQALQRNTPSASMSSLKIGDEVLVY